MQNRGSFFLMVSFISALLFLNSVSADTLFYEGFGSGFDWTTDLPPGWTASNDATSGMDDSLSITGGSDGNRYTWLNGLTGASNDQYINKTNISIIGYHNIKINYDYNLQGDFGDSDFLFLEWRLNSGGDWSTIQKTTGLPGWNSVSFNLIGAENALIDIRVRENNIDPTDSDTILIDNINISGSLISECGDGLPDNGEHCDDGNNINNDECTNNCTITFCGDGTAQHPNGFGTGGPQNDGNEACDDGNLNNNDGCDNNCISSTPICGNTLIESPETCDDGNTQNGDGCSATCVTEFCGDGTTQAGLGEQCDDGNTNDNDACNNDCTDNVCGDGFIETGVEQCDDGNTNDNDACNNDCTDNICGDSIIETGVEQCDDGNIANGDGCDSACQLEPSPNCGNGVIDAGEQCDDSNTVSGDGCSLTCQLEVCGNGILDAGEQCDDGNVADGDGCDQGCQIEPFCGDGCCDPATGENSNNCIIDCPSGNFSTCPQ